jgi:4-hydroxy-tetrahydrodipicolinate reductase
MKPIKVMINGLPGKMASETVKVFCENKDKFEVMPFSFCGPEITEQAWENIKLICPDDRKSVRKDIDSERPFIVVDFTLPDAVMENAGYYCKAGWNFVIGTTGADYSEIERMVAESKVTALAAPNMSIPIILIQSAISYLAESFPNSLDGWNAEIIESHQKGKQDTSGTAKLMVGYLKKLGLHIEVDQIKKIRDPIEQQDKLNIPEKYLSGHGYHTYNLASPDGTVELGFKHNVLGRRTYAVGTAKAVEFLHQQINMRAKGKVFNMRDVIK